MTGFNAVADNLTRIFFLASRDNLVGAAKTRQDDIWAYRFDWDEEPAPFNDIYGAAHAFDLPSPSAISVRRSTRRSPTARRTRPAGWPCRTR